MASISTNAGPSFNDILRTTLNTADPDSPRHPVNLLPLAAALLFSLHSAAAVAADIARDTPAASMALAEGLYATPGPSASVSTVATPTVIASPLPPTVMASPLPSPSPPEKVSAAAPSLVATAPPPKAPEAEWINYVAIIMGIVGAITGIAGAIMGGLGLRRASRQERR
jgi:hypothetical protein